MCFLFGAPCFMTFRSFLHTQTPPQKQHKTLLEAETNSEGKVYNLDAGHYEKDDEFQNIIQATEMGNVDEYNENTDVECNCCGKSFSLMEKGCDKNGEVCASCMQDGINMLEQDAKEKKENHQFDGDGNDSVAGQDGQKEPEKGIVSPVNTSPWFVGEVYIGGDKREKRHAICGCGCGEKIGVDTLIGAMHGCKECHWPILAPHLEPEIAETMGFTGLCKKCREKSSSAIAVSVKATASGVVDLSNIAEVEEEAFNFSDNDAPSDDDYEAASELL